MWIVESPNNDIVLFQSDECPHRNAFGYWSNDCSAFHFKNPNKEITEGGYVCDEVFNEDVEVNSIPKQVKLVEIDHDEQLKKDAWAWIIEASLKYPILKDELPILKSSFDEWMSR